MEAVYKAEVRTKDGQIMQKTGGLIECSKWIDEKLAENEESCAEMEKIT